MTADIELLPLPKKAQLVNLYAGRGIPTYGHSDETLTDYARAVAEHNVAARDAEIEALRAELDRLRGEHVRVRRDRNAAEARAERLAEALRGLLALPIAAVKGLLTCYQCGKTVTWLAPDSRCGDCTRLTPDEVRG